MKKIISIFLLSAIILQTFVNVSIGVYYHLNKAYIIRQLCENKSNPKLRCNGHCFLSKQLKKAEDKESKSSRLLKEKEEILSNNISNLKLEYPLAMKIAAPPIANCTFISSENKIPLLKPPIATTV